MNAAFSQRFRNLAITTPCCGATSTLNDLDYRAPQAFARFAISYLNSSRDLTIQQVEQIGEALGHPVRKVWAWI